MNVFTDLQKAWAHRFPGYELPTAWEEDVRANLNKHKQRIACLRDELEQEEFYVEYLERILTDVEKVKRNSLSGSDTTLSDGSTKQSDDEQDVNIAVGNGDLLEPHKDGAVTEEMINGKSSTERSPKRKDNPYVTVIEVNGLSKKPENKLVSLDEDVVSKDNGQEDQQLEKKLSFGQLSKKVPPKPPPKRPRQPSQEFSDKVLCYDECTGNDKTITSVANNTCNFSTFKPQISIESANSTPPSSLERSISTESSSKENSLKSEKSSVSVNSNASASSCANVGSVELNSNAPLVKVSEEYDEENIYDTVPFENELLVDNGEDKPATFDRTDDDQEGDYVVLSDKNSEHETHLPDSPNYSNYVNIDYFLREKVSKKDEDGIERMESITIEECIHSDDEEQPSPSLVRSVCSDQELDTNESNCGTISSGASSTGRAKKAKLVKEDAFDVDSGVYSSSVESASFIYSSSERPARTVNKQARNDSTTSTAKKVDEKSEVERLTMHKCILNSIIESETIYVECLTVMLQYMKALKATLTTSQPVISAEDFNTIFHKIPELHSLHHSFLEGIRDHLENPDGKPSIGDQFRMLAGKLNIYGAFLQNYAKAVDAIRRCNAATILFSEITKTIKLKTLKGQALSLEELLHKPVARVQKNALVLHDLLKYTPDEHADHKTLKSALKLAQCFLNELNMTANEGMFPPADRNQRHLVKNSFIVELSEGHRKLRHLFLFNDVIVCAKYKPSNRQKFTFEVKWYIPLTEIMLSSPENEGEIHVREVSSVDVLTLKARASTVREHIIREERLNRTREKPKSAAKNLDKHRKKLSELEAQLVLASPNLVFRIGHKSGRMYTLFLGSEFDRSQWTEALKVLHASALPNPPLLSIMELQAWIASCRQHLGGSFLFRSGLDDDLLIGTLQVSVNNLTDIIRPGELYVCFEVDSYGHFFRKAKTKSAFCTDIYEWNQDFVIDLEGSQSLRIICYEVQKDPSGNSTKVIIRGKNALELNKNWLGDQTAQKSVVLNEMNLSLTLKFISNDYVLKRVPLSRTVGSFGIKVNQVCKKEKSNVPFVIINCVNEVERRGMKEVGIYRVSGSTSDVQRLKKGYETNVYETEQLLKELDIHATTGLLKLYLRQLPEALFTDLLYPKFFEAFSLSNGDLKSKTLMNLFSSLPQINQNVIIYLIDHMVKINNEEIFNKMSLHNLATVFGPTLLRPGSGSIGSNPSDMLAAGTIDVMAQAGILYFFLKRKAAGLPMFNKIEDN